MGMARTSINDHLDEFDAEQRELSSDDLHQKHAEGIRRRHPRAPRTYPALAGTFYKRKGEFGRYNLWYLFTRRFISELNGDVIVAMRCDTIKPGAETTYWLENANTDKRIFWYPQGLRDIPNVPIGIPLHAAGVVDSTQIASLMGKVTDSTLQSALWPIGAPKGLEGAE